MAFSNETDKALYSGDGVSVNFAIPFEIVVSDSAEVEVYVRDETDPANITETLKVEGALQDYTLTGASPPTTPFATTVTFNTAPTSTQIVLVRRKIALTQTLDMSSGGAFYPETQELTFDRVVAMLQQINEKLARAATLMKTTQVGPLTFPEPGNGAVIGYNTGGTDLQTYTMDDLATAINGGVLFAEKSQSIGNGASSTALTSAVIDKASYRSARFDYCVERRTSTQGIRAQGSIIIEYDAYSSTWLITDINYTNGHGLTFTVNSSGQVAFSSDTMSGSSYTGTITWRLVRRFTSEA